MRESGVVVSSDETVYKLGSKSHPDAKQSGSVTYHLHSWQDTAVVVTAAVLSKPAVI